MGGFENTAPAGTIPAGRTPAATPAWSPPARFRDPDLLERALQPRTSPDAAANAARMTYFPREPAIPDGAMERVIEGAAETALSILPGSGEAMSLEDYFDSMAAVNRADGWAKVPHSAHAATALIGAIPVLGTVARGAKKAGQAAESLVDALTHADDAVPHSVGGSGIAEAAARNRALDPSLTVLPDDLAARATLGLPMDEASRMARAIDQGFLPHMPLFHGTAADIPAFDPSTHGDMTKALSAREGFFFSPGPETTSKYASLAAERTGGAPAVYPVVRRAPSRGRVKFGEAATEDEIAATLDRAFNDLNHDAVMLAGPQPMRSANPYSVVVKNPANIRSRFARFDPALADSPNLLASVEAWPVLGLGATGILDEEDTR